jgi:phage terminase large subunit-like protein
LHHRLQRLTQDQRRRFLEDLPDGILGAFLYDWDGAWARDSQLLPPGEWMVWLILAGRGFGKTRTGAETVRYLVERGQAMRIGLIAPTSADARDTMVEGESGILACSPPWNMPKYEPSKRRLTWPNGVRGTLFSAEEPERLRGPQHDLLWGDEPASWPSTEAWDNALMGLRLGARPRAIVTGTPKPVPLVLSLMRDPRTHVTRGSTFENAGNLSRDYIAHVKRQYEGTRVGRQELYAEVLEDMPGALFNQVLIDKHRVELAPELERIVISVDPAPTSESGSDECGIIAEGKGFDGHGYVLQDYSLRATPDEWMRVAVKAFYTWRAESIVAEINNGGDMVETLLRGVDPNVPFKGVRAMRGKAKRAEPIAALYEQGRVHHVGLPEKFVRLEKQMRVFTGINGRRDDRTDAMCWGLHELVVEGNAFAFV